MIKKGGASVGESIKVGLIGYGMSGRVFHAPLISATRGLELTAISSRSAQQAHQRYEGLRTEQEAEAIIEDPSLSLIVIATPNTSHAPLIEQALLAGKHVVVDKPFTITSAEAERCIEIACKQGKLLSVFHNRRWDADYATMKQVIDQNKMGRVVEYESHYNRFTPRIDPEEWRNEARQGSGVLYDLGSHLIDQALQLFGWPLHVTADIRMQRDHAVVDDYFMLCLDYDDVKVILKAGCLVGEAGPRFIVHGTEGSFVKYGIDPQSDALEQGQTPNDPNWGQESESAWGILNMMIDGLQIRERIPSIPGSYQVYYANIRDCILNGSDPLVKPEEALQVIRIIEAAMESSRNKVSIML
ncbi:oxidoreductase [Paenibacillus sp. FA6]|uniref:oxidoreductase n=1 Tax=Paenibacillus sp. FA6 TaxID=3413029 RepID=UPI003F656DC8